MNVQTHALLFNAHRGGLMPVPESAHRCGKSGRSRRSETRRRSASNLNTDTTASVEQRLISEQISQLTGRRFLDGYASDEAQYQALMAAGITYANEWQLIPGVGLTTAQMAMLTTDIVWLVEQEVTLPDGSTQTALVPQVYARVRESDLEPGGALIAANDIQLGTTGNLTNSGAIAGRQIVALTAENIGILRGRVTGQDILAQANNDLTVHGGTIEAERTLMATAGHDLTVQSSTVDNRYTPEAGRFANALVQRTDIDRVAGLYVTGENGALIAAAGNDLTLMAAALINANPTAAGNSSANGTNSVTLLSAGRDLTLGTVLESSKASTSSSKNRWREDTTTEAGSTLVTTGDLSLIAGNDLSARVATVLAGGALEAAAGNDLLIEAGEASLFTESWHKSSKSGFLSSTKKERLDTLSTTTALSSTFSGESVTLSAGNDLTIAGSQVSAVGDLTAVAGRDLILDTATETYDETHYYKEKRSGFTSSWGSIGYAKSSLKQDANGQGASPVVSSLEGQNILLSSGRDITAQATTLLADQDITLLAGRNIDLLAVADTREQESHTKNSSSSFTFNDDIFGKRTLYSQTRASQESDSQFAAQNTALLSANTGDLTILAGLDSQYKGTGQGNLLAQGADLLAGQSITLSANAVELLAAANEAQSHSLAKSQNFTFGAQPAGLLGNLINLVGDSIKRASETDNDRLAGALVLKAGYDSWKLYDGGFNKLQAQSQANLAGAGGNGSPDGALIGIQAYIGSSQSKSENHSSEHTVTGTNLQAQNITIEARETDIHLQGAKLQAEDIALTAQRDILLEAAANTAEVHNKNKSSSTGVGVTVGIGQQTGISVQLNAGQALGKANGNETLWDNTLITASNSLQLQSGRDTTLRGAQLAGESVNMDIGGNLLIETLQDLSRYESKQSSSGFNISLCIPPICYGNFVQSASFYSASQKIKHNYRSAVGQSGIAAGDGGFDITVKGGTELIGAAITSTQTAIDEDRNSLTTASLKSRDLENVQNTSASSSSLSAGYGSGASGLTMLASNATANILANLSGNAALPDNQNEQSQTLSVISPANITITGTGNVELNNQSQETVALLTSRDPETANQSLTNTLTLQQAQILEEKIQKQKENQEAARIIGGVLAGVVGDVAQSYAKDLRDQGRDEEAKLWSDGGAAKIALHGFAGLIAAQIGDGNLAVGALAGVGQEVLSPILSSYLEEQGFPRGSAEYNSLMQLGLTMAGAAVGAIADGTQGAAMGATTAFEGVSNNYLSHLENEARKELGDVCERTKDPEVCSAHRELEERDRQTDEAHKNACGKNGDAVDCFMTTILMINNLSTFAETKARKEAAKDKQSELTQAHRDELQSYLDLIKVADPNVKSSTNDKVRNPTKYDADPYGVIKDYSATFAMKFGTEILAIADDVNEDGKLALITDFGWHNGMNNLPGYALGLGLAHVDAAAQTKNNVMNEKEGTSIPYIPVDRFISFYAPTYGFVPDILDTALTKLGSERDAVLSLRGFMENIQDTLQGTDKVFNLVNHSRGGPETVQAFSGSDVQDFRNIAVVFHAGANTTWATNSVMLDKKLKDVINDSNRYRDSPYDLVPQIVGLRAFTSLESIPNVFTSILHSISLFGSPASSPHTLPYQWNNLQKED
ncbi:hypothetical protein FACS1894158_16540 [Betaproteobacteria bacterium]|nr:hypothetical protein FACS1894158_16540 [Betaproteobacteria bacterium]